jgi:predicted ABC-type ATPase
VDYFEGDFGKLALIPTQFLHAGVNPYSIKETVNGSGVASYTLYDGHQGSEANRVKALTGDGNASGVITVSAANLDAKKAAITAAAGAVVLADLLTITAASNSAADKAAAYALAKHRANLHLENAKCKGFIIPWDYLEVRYGGNIAQVRELTENGGGPRRMMEAMAALLVHSPLTFGMFDYKANNA